MNKTIIQEQLPIYLQAPVAHKTELINAVVSITGMHRKAVIRALRREQLRSSWKAPPKLGRPKFYTAETEAALAFVWEQYDYPSAERLHPEIPEAIRVLARDGMWQYGEVATKQLHGMSLGARIPLGHPLC